MDWKALKETLWRWYLRVAVFWSLQCILIYFSACVIEGGPVSPAGYVGFVYHCTQWRAGQVWLGKPGLYVRNDERGR